MKNTLKTVTLDCSSNRFLSTKLLFIFMIISNFAVAQTQRKGVDINRIIQRESIKYLYPPFVTNDTVECVLFLVRPEVKPDASLRIIETNHKAHLEVRCMDKNIKAEEWKRIFEEKVLNPESNGIKHIRMVLRENRDSTPLPIKTAFYSIPISKSFQNKVKAVFLKVKELNKNGTKAYDEGELITSKFDIFDGSSYGFLVNINDKMEATGILVSENDPYNTKNSKTSDFTYLVKLTNIRIINDIRNGTFKESKYDVYK